MRVATKIEVAGEFWLPGARDRKVGGTLIIEDGAEIHLEIIGLFWNFAESMMGNHRVPRIVGEVIQFGQVTLEDCVFEMKAFPSGSGPRKSRLYVAMAFLGAESNNGIEPAFTRYTFDVEGLDEWHGISSIHAKTDWENSSSLVSFQPPEPVLLWADEKARLTLKFRWSLPWPGEYREVVIKQSSYLELEYSTPRPMADFARILHQILQFYSIGLNKTVTLAELKGRSSDWIRESGSGKMEMVPVAIYFSPVMHTDKPTKIEPHRILFHLGALKGWTQAALDAWFSVHPKIAPTLNLYFSARTDSHRYLNVRFLFLVQALETLHRRMFDETLMPEAEFAELKQSMQEVLPRSAWDYLAGRLAYGNEPGLAKRIRSLFESFAQYFGAADEQRAVIQRIVDTRNYFTHYDPRLAKRAADGGALLDLCDKLETLFQLHMLRVIGFENAAMKRIIARHPEIGRKLVGLPPSAPEAASAQ